jgi:hypothetical protein
MHIEKLIHIFLHQFHNEQYLKNNKISYRFIMNIEYLIYTHLYQFSTGQNKIGQEIS